MATQTHVGEVLSENGPAASARRGQEGKGWELGRSMHLRIVRPARHDHTHGNDVFERSVHTHLQLDHLAARKHQKKAGGRIGCGGNVHTDMIALQMPRNLAARRTGHEGDGPRALMRILHQQCLAEGVAAAGKQRVRHLFDAAVNGLDQRNARHQPVPAGQPPLPHHIGHGQTGEKNGRQHQDHAHAGNVHQFVQRRGQAGRHRAQRADHGPEDAVEHGQQLPQHPDGDGQRQPDQHAGDENTFQAHGMKQPSGARKAWG